MLRRQWASKNSSLIRHIESRTRECLTAYQVHPLLVAEHANIERATAQGGYGRRQIYELVQNGADAMLGQPGGKIHVLLTETALYCANQGDPIFADGADAILSSHLSMKRGAEIGRFGLGFKSVLGVTDRPEFYSRSGSFGFDARLSEERIRAIIPDAERVPVLRIASPLDPIQAAAEDPNLLDLMMWASSVVKLPLKQQSFQWLKEDIQTFPSEFLLFSAHVGSLILEDRITKRVRNIRLETVDQRIMLHEGDEHSVWRVFRIDHRPSTIAREDAGELSDRETLPVMWAAPLRGRGSRGKFWAFFPTEYFTTLSGIVNAPWKTNEDRQNLLTGTFNQELIDVAAKLIAENLGRLVDDDDPGRLIDLLPGRGREAPNWADESITRQIYHYASQLPSIPNQEGILCRPKELLLHPSGIPRDILELWAKSAPHLAGWVHPSVETRERRSRVDRLFELAGRKPQTLEHWLEVLVIDRSAASSVKALNIASELLRIGEPMLSAMRNATIILTTTGALHRPQPGTIFLPGEDPSLTPDLTLVHPEVAAHPAGAAALGKLGIEIVDASSELESLLKAKGFAFADDSWRHFWNIVRRTPSKDALELLHNHHATGAKLYVRTASGRWKPICKTLLPGSIVTENDRENAAVVLDTAFHRDDLPLLREFGAVSEPKGWGASKEEGWFALYERDAKRAYMQALPTTGSKPKDDMLTFVEKPCAGPLSLLGDLASESAATYTHRLLSYIEQDKPWTLSHRSRPNQYPTFDYIPPSVWAIRTYGKIRTSLGPMSPKHALNAQWKHLSAFFPVAECSDTVAEQLELSAEPSADHWVLALKAAARCNDEALLGEFYSALAIKSIAETVVKYLPRRQDWDLSTPAPDFIRCRVGGNFTEKPPQEVTVVTNEFDAEVLVDLELPFIRVKAENANFLTKAWPLLPIERSVEINILSAASGAEIPLSDKFPGFAALLGAEGDDFTLIPCSSVRVETITIYGKKGEERPIARSGKTLYVQDRLDDETLIDQLAGVLKLQLTPEQRRQLIHQRQADEVRALRTGVRAAETEAAKLLAAVGPEAIQRRLPTGLSDTAAALRPHQSPQLQAAELALAVYGVEVLRAFRDELDRRGFSPPSQWAGSAQARQFVKSLGFSPAFAGFEQARRDPILEIDGPPNLPPLHGFQRAITASIRELLTGTQRRRGLLSLPTGAGKTRVATEALIAAFQEGLIKGPLLWVAQSDELCEQAVQTWSYVWRALGPQDTLTINRLWSANEAGEVQRGYQVVVATIQKLQHCINDEGYDWLQAGCIVIDEAHYAVGPSYTAVLDWQGLGRGKDRCPLIGLTATPFRGSERETEQLANRFAGHRLDRMAFTEDPYQELQAMGVLAQVDHELLEGTELELSDKELEELQRTKLFPSSAGERIGTNAERNRTLLNSIQRKDRNWPILLFAASVDHAQTMAALLNLEGIPAAAISAHTDPATRRYYIEEFRAGRIKVLTNYGVLTTGFDAPSIRAVYVARPTYSPILYQQMIGRGLRGPLNGGKERCLIVNVRDNVHRYGEDLAFRGFEHLWKRS